MAKRVRCQGKRFMRKLGVDDIYLMTGNGLNYEPDTSKGSGFLTSLFPVPLCNDFLVVQGLAEGERHGGRTDVCRLAHARTWRGAARVHVRA